MLFKKKEKEKFKKIRRSTSDTIPFINVGQNGIIEIEPGRYSATLQFKDINYSLSREEDQQEIFNRFTKILNYFNSDVNFQFTINNSNVKMSFLRNSIEMDMKHDGLDTYRQEFNNMLIDNVLEGKNNIRKDLYITIACTAKNFTDAKHKFSKMFNEISSNLKNVGSTSSALDTSERLEILYSFFRNGQDDKFEIDLNNDISVKDMIAPEGIEFKDDYFKIGDKFARALYLSNLPSYMNDKFTTELMELEENLMLSIHVQPMEIDKAVRLVDHRLTNMKAEQLKHEEAAVNNNRFTFSTPPALKRSIEEAEEFRNEILNKNQKTFLVSYLIVHLSDTKEGLDEDTKTLNSIANKNICKLGTLKFLQERGLRSILPLGVNELQHTDRCLTTKAATVLSIPFSSCEFLHDEGMYYGKNSLSGNVIMLDKHKLKSGNSFIIGTPGSGKSFTAKREMLNLLLTQDCDIFVIDPENEYGRLAKALQGEEIDISVNSVTHINPLDMEFDPEEDALRNKCEFMLSLTSMILGGKNGLSPIQKTIVDRVCHKVFANYISNDYDKKLQPTLLDFQNILEKEPEKEAKDLAIGLEIYAKGSLDLFSKKTNIDIKNRFQVFNIQKLGNGLKPLGLQITLESIWQKVIKNRTLGRQTVIIVDEAHLLFGAGNEYSANYMQALYKRARKYNCWVTCITQNILGMLEDQIGSSLIANSDFLQVLSQSPQDKEALAELLNISDLQLSYVSGSNPGEGLLIIGQTDIVPFTDKFPKDNILYKLMTTKPDEIKKFKKELEEFLAN